MPSTRPGTSPKANRFLIAAGLASLGVALLHVGIIVVGGAAYRYFGAGERMARMAERGIAEPTMITTALVVLFLAWAAYAFSGARLIGPLPRLHTALLLIGLIYAGRGLALLPQIYLLVTGAEVPLRHAVFSAISLGIGTLYVVGTIRSGAD
jgi:hypothetical protein